MASTDMDNFRELLGSSKNIIALAGAGLSAASGIPTFRGAGGMWRQYESMSLATPQGFRKSPSLVWQFYHYRRERALRANPNNAHRALSAFSLPAIRHQIAPDSTFTLITQNVDGLSPRSNKEVAEMFSETNTPEDKLQLIEMHGKLFDVVCRSKYCKHREFNTNSPICEALAGTELLVESGIPDPEIPLKDLPRCSKCGSLTRPGVVWFSEQPLHTRRIDQLVAKADLCLVIGTSSNVYPAAGYAKKVQDHGGRVAVFNLEKVTEADEEPDFLFLGPCEETLIEALGLSIPENGKISVKATS